MPLWLSPTQISVLTISEKQNDYAIKVHQALKDKGFRAEVDLRNEKVGFKIREHTLQKVPYLVIIGDKEVESGQVAIRSREGKDLGVMTIDTISDILQQEMKDRGLNHAN